LKKVDTKPKRNASWLKSSAHKVWDGFLQNIGVYIFGLIFGLICIAANWFEKYQVLVRKIPTDWVLTPLLLLIIIIVVLIIILYKQRVKLRSFTQSPVATDEPGRFVTHCGVWWRIFDKYSYIEDFPYCPCCEPPKKLVQIKSYPFEEYKCPATETEVKLWDDFPRKRNEVLRGLRRGYFKSPGEQLETQLLKRSELLRRLYPEKGKKDLVQMLLQEKPLNRLPKQEIARLKERFTNTHGLLSFINRCFDEYEKYLLPQALENNGKS